MVRRVLLGAGSSDFWIASLLASSRRRAIKVLTEWSRKVRRRIVIRRKIKRERRILVVYCLFDRVGKREVKTVTRI